MDFDPSRHFKDMLEERGIAHDWVKQALDTPDATEDNDDGPRHYLKQIPEFGNRWLRVIINIAKQPCKGVTAFFDRRLRRRHENQSR